MTHLSPSGLERDSLQRIILGILKHEGFAEAIIEAIDAGLSSQMAPEAKEPARHAAFNALVQRVIHRVQSHPRRHALVSLMRGSALPAEDAFAALEFVYSCVMSHLKGELAELLARPLLNDFASHLVTRNLAPPGIQILPGHTITAPRKPGERTRYKCADALLTATTDEWMAWNSTGRPLPAGCLVLIAAAEIKAYRKALLRPFGQIAAHVDRFGLGICVSGTPLDAAATFLATADKGGVLECVPCATGRRVHGFAQLVIRPCLTTQPPLSMEASRPHGWISELPCTSDELLEAAFRSAIWLVTQMVTDTFEVAGPGVDAALPACAVPANDGHLQDRFLEALYHFGRQDFFRNKSRKHDRVVKTFFWLYNSCSYGRYRAKGDRLQWPGDPPNLPRAYPREPETPATHLLADAWKAYARGQLRDALGLLGQADAAGIRRTHARRAAWLDAMIAYRDGRFAAALQSFPGAEQDRRNFWWPRDQVMLARLHARVGSAGPARELLSTILPLDQYPNRAFPVEYYGVLALTELAAGDQDSAEAATRQGIEVLEDLRLECQARAEGNRGEPWDAHPQTAQMGVFDLAAVLAATGHSAEVVHHLTQLSGFDGWELPYLKHDPLMGSLFNDIGQWPELVQWVEAEQSG